MINFSQWQNSPTSKTLSQYEQKIKQYHEQSYSTTGYITFYTKCRTIPTVSILLQHDVLGASEFALFPRNWICNIFYAGAKFRIKSNFRGNSAPRDTAVFARPRFIFSHLEIVFTILPRISLNSALRSLDCLTLVAIAKYWILYKVRRTLVWLPPRSIYDIAFHLWFELDFANYTWLQGRSWSRCKVLFGENFTLYIYLRASFREI